MVSDNKIVLLKKEQYELTRKALILDLLTQFDVDKYPHAAELLKEAGDNKVSPEYLRRFGREIVGDVGPLYYSFDVCSKEMIYDVTTLESLEKFQVEAVLRRAASYLEGYFV